jgi:PEGA domain-containing protein
VPARRRTGCTRGPSRNGRPERQLAAPPPGGGESIMSRVIAVVACGLALAACSTSLPSLSFLKSSPPTEALRIESEPPGAEAKTSLGQSCRTPCELVVQAADEFSLTLALNGYQPQTVSVRKDAAESSRLAPNPVYVELQPAPATPAKKRAAPKKKPAVAAQPAPAQSVSAQPTQAPAPATAAPVAPAPAVEAAASATNYPWPSR